MTSSGRSVWAVFAGFLVVVVLSMGTDAVMHATGVFPPFGEPMSDSRFLLATVYRVVYTVLGSYLTARLAPQRPMKHALVGGFIGLVLASVGAAATWNKGPEFGPHWYPLALVATALPCAWVGGRLGGKAEETQS
jgi:peptidoglycan/LPS O-acetylase OafA/YrhL